MRLICIVVCLFTATASVAAEPGFKIVSAAIPARLFDLQTKQTKVPLFFLPLESETKKVEPASEPVSKPVSEPASEPVQTEAVPSSVIVAPSQIYYPTVPQYSQPVYPSYTPAVYPSYQPAVYPSYQPSVYPSYSYPSYNSCPSGYCSPRG